MHAGPHLDSARVRLDINHIANDDFFFEDSLVYGRIQPKLFRAFDRFQPNDDVRYRLAVATQWVFRFGGRQLRDLAFVHFFCFFYPEA